ncbi:MAG: glycosyltransferase, partial [Parvularcula sp.]|nr:glycosyltransferase [Parvularcula sp.]
MRTVAFASRFEVAGPYGWPVGDLLEPLRELNWEVSSISLNAPPRSFGVARRIWCDWSAMGELSRMVQSSAADIVVLPSQPPMLPAQVLRRLRGRRAVLWAQDVYPDIAEALGVLPVASRIVGRRLREARRVADGVVALSSVMAERLEAQGARRVVVAPMWAPPHVQPQPRQPNAFRERQGLSDAFVVMYAGHFGRAHPVEGVLEAARLLSQVDAVRFVIVGGGPRWRQLQAQAPGNVAFV